MQPLWLKTTFSWTWGELHHDDYKHKAPMLVTEVYQRPLSLWRPWWVVSEFFLGSNISAIASDSNCHFATLCWPLWHSQVRSVCLDCWAKHTIPVSFWPHSTFNVSQIIYVTWPLAGVCHLHVVNSKWCMCISNCTFEKTDV